MMITHNSKSNTREYHEGIVFIDNYVFEDEMWSCSWDPRPRLRLNEMSGV